MGLKIYESVDPSSAFSVDGTFDNPVAHSFNGTTGEVIEKRYYVRNDDDTRWHSEIVVTPVDGGDNVVDGSGTTAGYSWKLIAGDQKPLEEQWGLVSNGAAISLSNIGSASAGDSTTYLPFWLKIEIPADAPVASYQGVILEITSEEALVP